MFQKFSQRFGKLFSAGLIGGLLLAACGAPMQRPMGPLAPINRAMPRFGAQNAPLVHGDLAVKFNNAYSALYSENEQIGRADPQNPDKLFTKLINEAKRSLDLAIFDLEEPSAGEALIQASRRGVKVRIVTDSDNMYERGNPTQYMALHRRMRAAGISIKGDKRHAFMHNKFMIIDSEHVVTGSLNLTPYSLYRDNNNSLKITSAQLVANYQAEFDRLYVRELFGPNPHQIPFPVVQVDGATIQTFFSPKGGTKAAILDTLSKARSSIRMLAFSVTDQDIQEMLVRKHQEGVNVQGIFDGCMISQYSIYQDMLTKNIPVMIDGNQALLHSKVFIVDNQVVITGSYNFSKNAENSNNENTLIIRSPKVAGFYNDEFERLKHASLTNKVPPYDNRACSSSEAGNDTQIQG